MPTLKHGRNSINYEVKGPDGAPTYVLVNGLTQYSALWAPYRAALVQRGSRMVSFDLLGQGQSDKPSLFIEQDDQVTILHALVEHVANRPVFLAGISFGGIIALRYAIGHGSTLAGLVPMSTFAELSPQLLLIGNALRNGLILGGIDYLQDLLLPMNVSDTWLAGRLGDLDSVKRPDWLTDDLYALQNLMESFLNFQPLTPQLPSIRVPTMILNGEFDFLAPRSLHETLRTGIPDSALVILQRGYHAFTLEQPELTARLLAQFAQDVLTDRWKGGGSIWLAPEKPDGEMTPFPPEFDHLRALPMAARRSSSQ